MELYVVLIIGGNIIIQLIFLKEWLKQDPTGKLKIGGYQKHAGCDFITVKSLQLLPPKVHSLFVDLGTPPNGLFSWTHDIHCLS